MPLSFAVRVYVPAVVPHANPGVAKLLVVNFTAMVDADDVSWTFVIVGVVTGTFR
jgi:hypothetical protein